MLVQGEGRNTQGKDRWETTHFSGYYPLIDWFSCNSHPLKQDSFINTVKRLPCVMADLLKNTIEKKDTKMVIISTSCSSISQWVFSHLIIPTVSVVLFHCGSIRRNQPSSTFQEQKKSLHLIDKVDSIVCLVWHLVSRLQIQFRQWLKLQGHYRFRCVEENHICLVVGTSIQIMSKSVWRQQIFSLE